jgi:hypothetical protein
LYLLDWVVELFFNLFDLFKFSFVFNADFINQIQIH